MDKPEALRLADALETGDIHENAWQAAAELRRLHKLLEAEQALLQRIIYPELQRLRAQRDALLEALKEIVDAADGKGWEQLDPSFKKARAAIKAVEGEKK